MLASARTRTAGRALCCAAFALLAGCSTGTRWASLGGEAAAEMAVHEAVTRYVHAYYDPPSWNPSPAAWCLATGRRSTNVLRERDGDRRSEWTPSLRLLSALSDLRPPVHPVEDCARDDDDRERLRGTGEGAILLVLSHPDWESHEFARVAAWTRQDRRASNRFDCRLARTMEAWTVQECL